MKIIDKYSIEDESGIIKFKLPVLSNQKMNSYLKELSQICSINKILTTHTARHTFSSVCHESGVAIENISKMLGHADTRMTLHYTKIADSRIKKDMKLVRGILD